MTAARHKFGGALPDWTFSSGTGGALTSAPSITITFYTALTGGTQYTDLQNASHGAVSSVTTDATGTIPELYGPPGVTAMAADANSGSGPRRWIQSTDLGSLFTSARPAQAVVYSNDCPASLKGWADDTYTWQCDGTNDEAEINAACNAVQATGQTSTTKPTGGGGTVKLIGNNFALKAPIVLQSWVDLSGAFGRSGCHINAVSGFSGVALITAAQSWSEMTSIHDVYLDGNNIGTNVHGVYLIGQTTQTPYTYADPYHTLRDITTIDTSGSGIYMDTATRVSMLSRIRSGTAGAHGFHINAPDSIISDCQSLGSDLSGFLCANTDTVFSNCISDNSHTYNWEVTGTRQQFSNCLGEDAAQDNWLISTGKVALNGCASDSAGLSSTGDGFHISSVSNLVMRGCQSYDRNGTPHQRYGVYLVGSCTYSLIDCVTWGNVTGSFGGTTTPGTGSTYTITGT